MPSNLEILKEYWGHDSFRAPQEDIICSVNEGNDTLAILPTGAGKSVCFQVPALQTEGLTIVISPLIALMADQVDGLRRRGIRSAALMGILSRQEILFILEQAEFGAYDLLYISPERINSPLFRKRLPFLNVSLIAVDEAHCISQWGYDFRPNYLRIAELREFFPSAPIIALTASATTKVIDDICDKLSLSNPKIIKGDFSRPNLTYLTRCVEDKTSKLIEVLSHVSGSIIIYVRYRDSCHHWVKELKKYGIDAVPYHAGLPINVRKSNQELWMSNKTPIIIATSAFGMGIDKADVRAVIHIEMPDTLEAYYQEAGRAGRDGNRAFAILIEDENDEKKLLRRNTQNFPPREYIAKVYQSLADFYVVGVLSGGGTTYAFNIIDFASACKLNGPSAMAALKLLQMADYITLLDEMENPSKLRITTPRDALYYTKYPNQLCERIIELLLRTHTAILSDNVHISEDFIASKLNITREQVYSSLILLSKCDIVNYIPFKRTPLIHYNRDRVPNEEIYIPKEIYEDRQQLTQSRAENIIHYAHQEEICRERVLMQYFDVDNGRDCGYCDVCKAKKKNNTPTQTNRNISREEIKMASLELLANKPIAVHHFLDDLMSHMKLTPSQRYSEATKISDEIRALIDDKILSSDSLYISISA